MGLVNDGEPNFIGSGVAVCATAGLVGVRDAAGLGVATFATACVGVATATVDVSGKVGIGVTVGAVEVAVGGGPECGRDTVFGWLWGLDGEYVAPPGRNVRWDVAQGVQGWSIDEHNLVPRDSHT